MMKNLILFLMIQLHKLKLGSTVNEPIHGNFIVEYLDGNCSRPMYWKNAKNYCEIFEGRVIHQHSGRQVYFFRAP